MQNSRMKILFIVESAINKNDGYKSRIEMEMGLLAEKCDFSILIPWEGQEVDFSRKIKIYTYNAVNEKLPFVFNWHRMVRKLEEILINEPNCIVCCEALPSAVCAYNTVKKFGNKLIFDCHGTAPDEAYLYHPNLIGKLYASWLRLQQKKIVENSDLIITVSKKQYNCFNTSKPYVLLPMLPAQQFLLDKNDKAAVRKKLGIPSDAVTFCYSGQNQKWQMSEKTIEYYKKIETTMSNAFLLILTGNIDEFKALCKKYDVKHFTINKVPYNEMPYYLDAADYGFCLRENHIINLVASPTKVLEYLSRNIVPIITPYVGDFSEQLKKHNLCVCLDNFENVNYPNNKRIAGKQFVMSTIEEKEQTYIKAISRLGDLCNDK